MTEIIPFEFTWLNMTRIQVIKWRNRNRRVIRMRALTYQLWGFPWSWMNQGTQIDQQAGKKNWMVKVICSSGANQHNKKRKRTFEYYYIDTETFKWKRKILQDERIKGRINLLFGRYWARI